MSKNKKCSQCENQCVTKVAKKPSSICIVNGPKQLTEALTKEELKLRIWAYMRPPRISDPTPAVNPERLEKIRDLLSDKQTDTAIKTHVDSDLSIQVMADGSVKKTRSLREIKIYPPMAQMPNSGGRDYCRPDCSPASKEELTELFKSCKIKPSLKKKERR